MYIISIKLSIDTRFNTLKIKIQNRTGLEKLKSQKIAQNSITNPDSDWVNKTVPRQYRNRTETQKNVRFQDRKIQRIPIQLKHKYLILHPKYLGAEKTKHTISIRLIRKCYFDILMNILNVSVRTYAHK